MRVHSMQYEMLCVIVVIHFDPSCTNSRGYRFICHMHALEFCQHCLIEHLTSILYVCTADILWKFHLLLTNAAQTGSVVDFVLLSTCWQALQPPLKTPQTVRKGKFSFPSPTLIFAYWNYPPYGIRYASMYIIPSNVDPCIRWARNVLPRMIEPALCFLT